MAHAVLQTTSLLVRFSLPHHRTVVGTPRLFQLAAIGGDVARVKSGFTVVWCSRLRAKRRRLSWRFPRAVGRELAAELRCYRFSSCCFVLLCADITVSHVSLCEGHGAMFVGG